MPAPGTLPAFLRLAAGLAAGGALALASPELANQARVELEAPEWLPLLLALGPLWMIGAGTLWRAPAWQRWAALTVRSVALCALAAALVQPVRMEPRPRPVDVVLLEDRSPSVAGSGPALPRSVPPDAAATRVLRLGFGAEDDAVASSDLERVLALAATLARPERETRLLLRTDGGSTGGPLSARLSSLRAAGLDLAQERLASRLDEGDVAVLGVSLPPRPSVGGNATVEALLSAPAGTPLHCALTMDGKPAGEAQLEAAANGEGAVSFERVPIKSPDPVAVEVRCRAAGGGEDAVPGNDAYRTMLVPDRRPRVLVVDRSPAEARTLVDAIGSGFDVTLRGAGGVPRGDEEWSSFDMVLLSDLPRVQGYSRDNFTPRQMAEADRFVRQGGGLLLVGGPKALGMGGFGGTLLERRTLPVWLDAPRRQQVPRLAMVLVLDRSGSMSGMKLDLARQAAEATVSALGAKEQIGVVAFDSKPDVIVELQRAASRFRIFDDLRRLGAGGGTRIRPALAVAFRMLRRSDARFRHVILLTDGQSPREGVLSTVQAMAEAGITVSTVAVGRAADRALLRDMAEAGSGRYHFTDSPERIPRIFVRETREVRRASASSGRFRPRPTAAGRRTAFLRAVAEHLPPLDGMALLRAKPGARVLLRGDDDLPALTVWRRGEGRVAVFAADAKGVWSSAWLRSPVFRRFWRGLLREIEPVSSTGPAVTLLDRKSHLLVRVRYPSGDRRARAGGSEEAPPQVRLRWGDEPWLELRADRLAPGVFEARHDGARTGVALVEVTDPGAGPRAQPVRRVLARPYAPELDPSVLRSGREELDRLAAAGTLPYATLEDLLAPPTRFDELRKELWPLPLIAFMALWLLGLLLRRLPLGRSEPAGWL